MAVSEAGWGVAGRPPLPPLSETENVVQLAEVILTEGTSPIGLNASDDAPAARQ